MEDTEYGHFDAEKHRRDANLEVRRLNCFGGLDGTAGGEEIDDDLGRRRLGDEAVIYERGGLTFCQNDRNMTSLIAEILSKG